MIDREPEWLAFDEDEFDLEAHKRAADAHTKKALMAKRARRRVSLIKILIVILAFVTAYLLYSAASELILRYDYNRYHSSMAID